MRLGGYGKLTLQDYPGQVAAICFTAGCQLRCPYCHNAGIVLSNDPNSNPEGETALALRFLSYLNQRKSLLDGVVVSGGEPLLQADLVHFLRTIKNLGLAVKLDTNGFLSSRLQELIAQDLVDYVALDYKNCRQRLAATIGLSGTENQATVDRYYHDWQSSLACLRQNRIPYELRTTVVRELHPLAALQRMAESIRAGTSSRERWFLQAFVKDGPLLCDYLSHDQRLSAYSDDEMESIRLKLLQQVPGVQRR